MSQAKTQNHWLIEGIIRVVVWGIVLLFGINFFYFYLFHGPVTTEEGRREHGNGQIHAPFCCVYVGLDENERILFDGTFQKFAERHDLRKAKRYTAYSGPPRAQFVNERLAVYVHSMETTDVIKRHDRCSSYSRENVNVGVAMWSDCFWPTNASQITKNGQKILAPFTGNIGIASYISNYPLSDFKQLAHSLKASIQTAFPNRTVEIFVFDGSSH